MHGNRKTKLKAKEASHISCSQRLFKSNKYFRKEKEGEGEEDGEEEDGEKVKKVLAGTEREMSEPRNE